MKLRRTLFALLATAALASCNVVSPIKPDGSATGQVPWAQFTQQTIDGWLKADPAFAVYQGAHQYDGKFSDWSTAGLVCGWLATSSQNSWPLATWTM